VDENKARIQSSTDLLLQRIDLPLLLGGRLHNASEPSWRTAKSSHRPSSHLVLLSPGGLQLLDLR